jgi:hypothetical protein
MADNRAEVAASVDFAGDLSREASAKFRHVSCTEVGRVTQLSIWTAAI